MPRAVRSSAKRLLHRPRHPSQRRRIRPCSDRASPFTATISSGSGSLGGHMNFSIDGGTPVTVTLSSGTAVYTTSGLSVGAHTITASFTGTGTFGPSQGSVSETVNQASTTTTVGYSGSFSYDQLLTLTASVAVVSPAS